MDRHEHRPPPSDKLKRLVLMTILGLAWVSSNIGWAVMESQGKSSAALRTVFVLNALFHPTLFVVVWRRLLPLRAAELACLLFAAVVCAVCMALRLYWPGIGAEIDLQPLYLWIPVIYVFAFTLPDHKASLKISLAIMALFVVISLPYLAQGLRQPYGNFTVQLHLVSTVLIVALYFFASHRHDFQLAQLTVDQLARLANTDELTQLANRRRTAEAIDHELVRYGRYGHPFSVILIDIDHFKDINDRFGHGVGDQTLVALAARTTDMLRDVDTFGRWGGEEFVVILPQTGFGETLLKAMMLCRHVATRPLVGEHATTISCGVTCVAPGDSAHTLLQRADVALYAAKRGGRNRAEGVHERAASTA